MFDRKTIHATQTRLETLKNKVASERQYYLGKTDAYKEIEDILHEMECETYIEESEVEE